VKIIEPEVHLERQDWGPLLQRIELKGRVCYKSEDRINAISADAFIQALFNRGHLSVLEHSMVSVKFVVDRGVSHEIVRHRLAAYSQESTRYCNYGNSDDGLTLINPFFFDWDTYKYRYWLEAMQSAEKMYLYLLKAGASAQEARSVLPNSLKTEIWMTANLREWLHFCLLRAAKTAHPQMRQVAIPLLLELKRVLPPVFAGVGYDAEFKEEHYAVVLET